MKPGLDWAVAALILTPYLGLVLPFQGGLMIQAAILVTVLVQVTWPRRTAVVESLRSLPRSLSWGLGLWSAAAAWGAVVGVASGNPLRYVASQTLAMGLLVAAAVAFRAREDFDGRDLARGFAGAAVVALILHLLGGRVAALETEGGWEGFRFLLRNNVGVPGVTVMAFLVLTARWADRVKDWPLMVGPAAAALLLAGGMSRGSWIAAGAGVVVLLALQRRRRRVLALTAGGMLLALAAAGWITSAWMQDRGMVLEARGFEPDESPRKPERLLLADDPAVHRGRASLRLVAGTGDRWRTPVAWNLPLESRLLQVELWARGGRQRRMTLSARFLDDEGEVVGQRRVIIPGQGEWGRFRWLAFAPHGTSRVRLWTSAGAGSGTWLIDDLTVREIPSSWATPVYQLAWRASSALRGAEEPSRDGGAAYRLAEFRAVRRAWAGSSLPSLLAGQGLGATFRFDNFTWDSSGARTTAAEASYIHNFYVFLAFKLGVVGLVALGGLLWISGWTWARAKAPLRRPGAARRWLFAGAAASWAAYLIWSMTSPEIYSFKSAPLWGALVAACANEWEARQPHAPRADAPGGPAA